MTTIEKIISVLITLIILALFLTLPLIAYKTDEVVACKVQEKERVNKSESSKYIIFCEEEVFENTDSLWYLKFNSSDIYRDLKVGGDYKLRVYGFRIPFLSMYRNIIEVK